MHAPAVFLCRHAGFSVLLQGNGGTLQRCTSYYETDNTCPHCMWRHISRSFCSLPQFLMIHPVMSCASLFHPLKFVALQPWFQYFIFIVLVFWFAIYSAPFTIVCLNQNIIQSLHIATTCLHMVPTIFPFLRQLTSSFHSSRANRSLQFLVSLHFSFLCSYTSRRSIIESLISQTGNF